MAGFGEGAFGTMSFGLETVSGSTVQAGDPGTVGRLVDRTLLEWLVPSDDQAIRFRLDAALDDTAATLTYSADLLLPEEELLLGPGALVEVDQELIILGQVNSTSNTVSGCVRGANGTDRATHSSGAIATLRPTFPRSAVFDALADAILGLYPRIPRRRSTTVTIATGYTEAPADVLVPESFIYLDSGYVHRSRIAVVDLADSSTGKALLALDAPVGTTGTLTYRCRFVRPDSEADLLEDDLGVLPEYEGALQVRAVANLISNRDLDAITSEYLTRQLEAQNVQVGSATRLREALLRYYEYLLTELGRMFEPVVMRNGWVV